MFGIQIVRQVLWLYHLNTGHPCCPIFRWLLYDLFISPSDDSWTVATWCQPQRVLLQGLHCHPRGLLLGINPNLNPDPEVWRGPGNLRHQQKNSNVSRSISDFIFFFFFPLFNYFYVWLLDYSILLKPRRAELSLGWFILWNNHFA